MDLVEKERNGEEIDGPLVSGVVEGFVRLGLNRERPKEVTLDVYKGEEKLGFLWVFSLTRVSCFRGI